MAALPARLLALVFLPFAAGFFLSILLRNVNAVISKDIAAQFALSSSELGLLTSTYFIAFAALQIPLGILLDRYGPRRVTSGLLLVAAAGALAFASAGGLSGLTLGRALIGAGASACLMGSMKAFTLWFPLERLATLNGWILAVGALGAVAATVPVELATSEFGWRAMFAGLALFSLVVSACIYLLVPEKPVPGATELWREQFSKISAIFAAPAFWRVGMSLVLLQGTYQALFGLWLVPWLMDTQGLARGEAARWLLYAALAYAFASIAFGQGADRLAERGLSRLRVLQWGTGAAVAGFVALGFVPRAFETGAAPRVYLWCGRADAGLRDPFTPLPCERLGAPQHGAERRDLPVCVRRPGRHGHAAADVSCGGRAVFRRWLCAGVRGSGRRAARRVGAGGDAEGGAGGVSGSEVSQKCHISGSWNRSPMAAICRTSRYCSGLLR